MVEHVAVHPQVTLRSLAYPDPAPSGAVAESSVRKGEKGIMSKAALDQAMVALRTARVKAAAAEAEVRPSRGVVSISLRPKYTQTGSEVAAA
jgi:hypothetical protein